MKSIVIYFSQTGNTRKIAEAIYSGIYELTRECDMARLQDVKAEDLKRYELIGLGSPVWHRREPINVLSFVEYTMHSLEGKKGFVFCTHGLYPGHFIGRMVPALTLEGLKVIGWKNWYCSAWVPEHPKPYFTDGHPDSIDLEEAKQFGKDMVERSRRISAGEPYNLPTLLKGQAYHDLYPGPGSTDRTGRQQAQNGVLELIDLRSFDFIVNKEKCLYPRCTVCIDNCPTHSINFFASPPIFRKNCDRCWFCEQICPRGAIEVNWAPIAEYVENNIVKDWFRVADDAVARGLYRRLIPNEDIGKDGFWYKAKKPRLKLLSP
jgi:flavodoxin/ferredoxin